jgi:glycosyltransferase involved in cell wall biosynthesis
MTTILHAIETSGPGGAEKMLISLVEHLDDHRYESIVCLPGDGWLNAELQARGVETMIRPQQPGLDAGWLIDLVKILRRRRVGLMHAQEFSMNTYCSAASALTGIPIVTTVQGKNYYPDRWRRRLAYRLVARQSRMVAVSDDIRRFLVKRVGVSEHRVTTIYNAIEPRAYRSDHSTRAVIRRELGLGEGRPVIGTVGNLYPVKGHVHLLKAMAAVVARRPDAVCLILGRGELLGPLRQTAAELGVDRNVRFLGFREDVAKILRAMDLFVLPSLSEGLSLALLEAMAAGKAVVATAVGGNPEVVLNGHTGVLVPPEDAAALADAILLLLGDPALAGGLGESGRLRVDKEFSVTAMVQRYEALYAELLSSFSPRMSTRRAAGTI